MTCAIREREAYYAENARVVKDGNMYSVQETDSYFSDSLNPEGEWATYWAERRAYRTLAGARRGLAGMLKQHFPAGHDIECLAGAILAKLGGERLAPPSGQGAKHS